MTATDPRTGFDRLSAGRRRLAPVVDAEGRLVGVLTRQGALRATLYKPAVDDRGRLRIAAAIGINGDVTGKAAALLKNFKWTTEDQNEVSLMIADQKLTPEEAAKKWVDSHKSTWKKWLS